MNLLVNIANEDENAYCVCPNHIRIAINRGVSKPDICMAMVEIQAGINKEFIPWNADKVWMEDLTCCAFVANSYEKE